MNCRELSHQLHQSVYVLHPLNVVFLCACSSGTHVCGDEDGVHQEPELLRAVAGGVRLCRHPLHRVRASVHAVLAARSVEARLTSARPCCRQGDPQHGPRRPHQGEGQGRQEEGAVILLLAFFHICACNLNILYFLHP